MTGLNLIEHGLTDLTSGLETIESLLVSIAARRRFVARWMRSFRRDLWREPCAWRDCDSKPVRVCADVLRRMQIYLEFQRQRIGDALERRDAEIPGRIFQRGGLLARHAELLAELRL